MISGYLEEKATGIVMSGKTRSEMLLAYIVAIENDEIQAPYIEYMEGEHKYVTIDDLYGSGHLPDTISAGALAWRAHKKGKSGKTTWGR